MADHEEEVKEVLAMGGTKMESTVEKSHPNLVADYELDSREWNQLQTEYLEKPSGVIDQVQDILEENIQGFSEYMPPRNNLLP